MRKGKEGVSRRRNSVGGKREKEIEGKTGKMQSIIIGRVITGS